MRRKIKLISFQVMLLLAMLVIVEIAMRTMGYSPGDMRPNWLNFRPVDSLYLIPDFYVNHDGILIADRARHAVIRPPTQ